MKLMLRQMRRVVTLVAIGLWGSIVSDAQAAAGPKDGEIVLPADYKSWPKFLKEVQREDAKKVSSTRRKRSSIWKNQSKPATIRMRKKHWNMRRKPSSMPRNLSRMRSRQARRASQKRSSRRLCDRGSHDHLASPDSPRTPVEPSCHPPAFLTSPAIRCSPSSTVRDAINRQLL